MIRLAWLMLLAPPDTGPGREADASRVFDAPLPPQPEEPPWIARARAARAFELHAHPNAAGRFTTLYVNFDGIELDECKPSNSKKNCHWYNFDRVIEPFSGELSTQVAVLQAMRRHAEGFGIRITGVRPSPDDDYTMVIYGGTEEEFGALGSAPAGDCLDANPNEIAFAHVDGDLNSWINGGATTALHEAGHTWGLDHTNVEGTVMFPSGDNSATYFDDGCEQVVENVSLDPIEASCSELSQSLCAGASDRQNAAAVLRMVFGPPYVDTTAPQLTLANLEDGQYFQAPADFDIVLEAEDDLHPQAYSVWGWLGDDPRPSTPDKTAQPGFKVRQLPVGTWTFHVAVADEAGNESQIDFDIEVGVDPPPDPAEGESCACRSGNVSGSAAAGWFGLPALALRRRRR